MNKIMNINKTVTKLTFGALLFGGLITGCGGTEEASTTVSESIQVEIGQVRSSMAISTKQLSGSVKSETRSEIGTKILGEIETIRFEIGEQVQKGQVLIQIKDDDLQARKAQIESGLEEVNANLELVEKDYNRFKTLFEQGSATQRELDEVQTTFASTKASKEAVEHQLREMEDMLSYTRITAPYTGVIAARYVDEGDIANPGMPLIALEKEQTFEVEVTVPESSIGFLNIGDTLAVSIPTTGTKIDGVVDEISSSGDPMSRQFKANISVHAAGGLRSGMYAEVAIRKEDRSTLFVPKTALVERGQLAGLYAVSANNNAVLRWVTLGIEQEDMVEVLSGMKDGEQFVVNASAIHFDGQKVTRIN